MSKESKDSKHRLDGVRMPQRKDSLSSLLSWAALQGKLTVSRAPTLSSVSTPVQPSQTTSTQNGSRPRRHSHGAGTETKTKTRRGSTTFRRSSFSNSAAVQAGTGTKTDNVKISSTASEPKGSPATVKPLKSGLLEKVAETASDTPEFKTASQTGPGQSAPTSPKPRPSASQGPVPKSILRVSSPEGCNRPQQSVTPKADKPTNPPAPAPSTPSTPSPSALLPPSPPASPPPSPTTPSERPTSPGTTVRFAKATVHRVDVGPGRRRFLPVKRKSKSTLTYISPLDPGTQKGAPKTMLQNPVKLRRHQENQAAMGRYWLRTEEEEAQWRAEAARRAEEEAERYRREPASPPPLPSPPPPAVSADGKAGEVVVGAAKGSQADETVTVNVISASERIRASKPEETAMVASSAGVRTDEKPRPEGAQGASQTERHVSANSSGAGQQTLSTEKGRKDAKEAGKPKSTSSQAEAAPRKPGKVEVPIPSAQLQLGGEQSGKGAKRAVTTVAAEKPENQSTGVADKAAPARETRPPTVGETSQKGSKSLRVKPAAEPAVKGGAEKPASASGSATAELARDDGVLKTASAAQPENTARQMAETCISSRASTSNVGSRASATSQQQDEGKRRDGVRSEETKGDVRKEEEKKDQGNGKGKPLETLKELSTTTTVKSVVHSKLEGQGESRTDKTATRTDRCHATNSNKHNSSDSHGSVSNHLQLSDRSGRRCIDHKEGITA